VLSGIDVNGLDGGECGATASLAEMERLGSCRKGVRRRRVGELESRRGVLNDPYGSRTLTREAYSTDRETPASSQAANDTVLA
jgi:hypothetical protein